MRSLSADPRKLRVVPALPEVLAKGRLVESHPSYDPRETSVRAYHTLSAKVDVGGERLTVRAVVREDANGDFYWDHRIDENGRGARAPEDTSYEREPGDPPAAAAPADMPAKGEDFNLDAEAAPAPASPPGLFDDIRAEPNTARDAATRLAPCAPGGGE